MRDDERSAARERQITERDLEDIGTAMIERVRDGVVTRMTLMESLSCSYRVEGLLREQLADVKRQLAKALGEIGRLRGKMADCPACLAWLEEES